MNRQLNARLLPALINFVTKFVMLFDLICFSYKKAYSQYIV